MYDVLVDLYQEKSKVKTIHIICMRIASHGNTALRRTLPHCVSLIASNTNENYTHSHTRQIETIMEKTPIALILVRLLRYVLTSTMASLEDSSGSREYVPSALYLLYL